MMPARPAYSRGSNESGQLGNASNPRGWYRPVPVWAPTGG